MEIYGISRTYTDGYNGHSYTSTIAYYLRYEDAVNNDVYKKYIEYLTAETEILKNMTETEKEIYYEDHEYDVYNYCDIIEINVIGTNDIYNPSVNGAVVAMRIFFGNDRVPMAELAFAYGGTQTIEWTNVDQRMVYSSGINGYTLIYDERDKADFQSQVRSI